MLSSFVAFEHVSFVLLMLDIIHKNEALLLIFPLLLESLGFNLLWIQEIAFFQLLVGVDQSHRHLLLQKPFIRLLQIVLLIPLIF